MPSSPPVPSAALPSVSIKMKFPRRLLIGLSGGADSMALCHLLRQREDLDLCAVHVNHSLRGEASDADEAFVRDICQRWQLPLLVYHAQPPEHPGEDWARQARYGFYRQAMEERQAEAIALAHHRDDQAETLLLHLLRGAGLTGLSAMAADSEVLGVRVVRPLLDYSRQELRDILTQANIPWREDASNQDPRYLRNALRHQLLPLMEQLAPGAIQRLAATASLLREDDAALTLSAQAFLQQHGGNSFLPLNALRQLPAGLANRVLRLWWLQYAGGASAQRGLTHQQTSALSALVNAPAGSQCNLPGNCHGYCGWTHLHLLGKPLCFSPLTYQVTDGAATPGDGRHQQALPRALLEVCTLRTREPGDWIRPFGQRGRQSLQDYFVNKRVDAPFRDHVPLLCRGSEVLLVSGVGAGDVPPFNTTADQVMLRWLGDMPWAQE